MAAAWCWLPFWEGVATSRKQDGAKGQICHLGLLHGTKQPTTTSCTSPRRDTLSCALRTPLHSFAARQRTLLSRRQHPYLGLWRYAWEDAVISRTSGRALILLAGPPSQRGDSGYAKTTSRACVHLAGEHARFSNTVPRASWDDLSSWHGGSGALWPTSSSSGTLQEVGASAAGRDA